MAPRVTATEQARSANNPVVTQQRRGRDAVERAREDAAEVNRERLDRLERRALRTQLERAQRPEPKTEPQQQRLPGRRPIGQNLDVFA